MTFKPNAVKRLVTGTFQKPDGTPSEGKINLELSEVVLGRQENVIYTSQKIEIALDAAGSFSKELSVTMPGLTTEELTALNNVQAARVQNLENLAAVQVALNTYLNKLAANQAVTTAETTKYKADVELKKSLQVTSISLSKNYQDMLDAQQKLADNEVRMRVRFNFTNPIDRGKIEFIIPPGTGPIDIADLPRA